MKFIYKQNYKNKKELMEVDLTKGPQIPSNEIRFDNVHLNIALMNLIIDPKNPSYNFILAKCYEDLGQTASAASYYLRAAEFSIDDLLSYESLLRLALCLQRQGSRLFTVKGILLRAISLIPTRPEAYFLLSRIYETNKEWQEAYTIATIGEKLVDDNVNKLRTDVEYPGKYGFTFEKAVVAWWIGLYDESVHLFRQLNKNPYMLDFYTNAVRINLSNFGITNKKLILYDDSLYEQLRMKFTGAIDIKSNYAVYYQDMFVLTMLNGKRNGLFLEIGCGDAFYGNNTALLEKEFGWSGISIDIDENIIDNFKMYRNNKAICYDATKINYKDILDKDIYDYLQINCEYAPTSYLALLKIPFETHKFAVITFEHDFYIDEKSEVKEKSRKYLESYGYQLIIGDVSSDKFNSYEDWWVHPDLISNEVINKMKYIKNGVKKADEYMLNKITT